MPLAAAGSTGLRRWLGRAAVEIAAPLIGQRFSAALSEMQRAQWLSPAELRARAESRLASLLQHAARNVPFYVETCRRLGLDPRDLRTSEDLARLPVLSKTDYRSRPPEDFCARNAPPHLRLERTTSGSTGEPLRFALDRRALPVIFASHLFYDSWFGLRPFDRYVRIMSPPASVPLAGPAPALFRVRQAVTERLQRAYERWTQERIHVWEVDAEKAEQIWRRIEAFQPDFVLGYTSTLAVIADELLRRGLRLSRPVRGVITVAETLTPARRRLIERYFQAPIINRYGLRELGSWSAQSCRVSAEQFHINTELAICEVLRPDGSPAAPGETGRVVLTDLWNFARPFIRYETGDLAVVGSGTCDCGRGFPLLGPIEGRSEECLLTPSGKVISPAVLGHYLVVYNDNLDLVRHYQLVQLAPGRACLLVVPTGRWKHGHCQRLRQALAGLLGEDVQTEVRVVAEIPPERSGKRPIIKSAGIGA